MAVPAFVEVTSLNLDGAARGTVQVIVVITPVRLGVGEFDSRVSRAQTLESNVDDIAAPCRASDDLSLSINSDHDSTTAARDAEGCADATLFQKVALFEAVARDNVWIVGQRGAEVDERALVIRHPTEFVCPDGDEDVVLVRLGLD